MSALIKGKQLKDKSVSLSEKVLVDSNLDMSGYTIQNALEVEIAGVNITSITTDSGLTSASDNQLATSQAVKDYVDAAVSGENLWDRNGTTLSPSNAGDGISVFDIKLSSGATINNIVTDSGLTSASDNQLATAKAVKDYVNDYALNNVYFEEEFTTLNSILKTATGATGAVISKTPFDSSSISATINGINYRVKDTSAGVLFFQRAGAPVNVVDVVAGDTLCFSGIAAGFKLDTDDEILLTYNTRI